MHCTQPWQFKSGNTWMQLVVAHFLAGTSAHLSLIFFNILVGATRFVAGVLHPLAPH